MIRLSGFKNDKNIKTVNFWLFKVNFHFSGKLLAVQSEGDFRGQLIEGLHKAANDAKTNFELFELAVTKRFTIHNTA